MTRGQVPRAAVEAVWHASCIHSDIPSWLADAWPHLFAAWVEGLSEAKFGVLALAAQDDAIEQRECVYPKLRAALRRLEVAP